MCLFLLPLDTTDPIDSPIVQAILIDGDGGGRIVATGTPEDVAKVKESYTGQYLRELLGRRAASGKKQAAE
jgi:hypothetical protein